MYYIQQNKDFFCLASCFALHMLSLNSFWWLIYGRVIINFDLVLSPDFFLLHNVKHGSLRRDYLLSTRLNSNQPWPSRCYPTRWRPGCTLGWKSQILFSNVLLTELGSKCFVRVACLWSKMPMFQRAGMQEGGSPLPPAFSIFDSCYKKITTKATLLSLTIR